MLSSSTQTVLALAFLLQSTLSISQNFDCTPPTFFKISGSTNSGESGISLTHSNDGNFYLAGRAGNKTFIQKINFAGESVWMHTFTMSPPVTPNQIVVDSEGMIVGCGIQDYASTGDHGFVFRYDPSADSLLWSHSIESEAPRSPGILEKSPGGNFIFYQNPNTDFDVAFIDLEMEILELDRATGSIVPGFANRYGYLYLDALEKMVMINGALYGLGSSTCRHDFGYKSNQLMLARFDPSDGTPVWAQLSHADTNSVADFFARDLAVDGDALVAAYVVSEDASDWPLPIAPYYIHLQKTDLGGNILWVRKYAFNTNILQLLVVPDGYILTGQRSLNKYHFAIKVNKNGDFLWGKELDFGATQSINAIYWGPNQSAIEADSLYMTGVANTGASGNPNFDVFFWKMLTNGSMSDSCGYVSSIDLDAIDVQNPVRTPITLYHFASPAIATAVNAPWVSDSMAEKILCPQYAPMSLACPADIEVSVGPGAGGAPAAYNLPTGTTDCDCPGFEFTLTAGLSSGSLFPVGNTQVCYSAEDDCGTSAGCCFSVKVNEDDETPCDTKNIGCMRYDLLGITADAQQRRTYRIRATNNCSNKLIYTAIQLPDGVVADNPANLSIYTSPQGSNYDVRNPNFSPFYSIRFKSATDGISNGESDVWEYTLPAQSQPAYIHVTSRLDPQLFYEAFLNTFNCPIGTTPSQNRSESSTATATATATATLFPNPSNGELFADLSRWQGESLTIQILDSRGQRVQSFILNASGEAQPVPIGSQLSAGLYFLEIATGQGEREVTRFVLER